jgi:hypothetical protein
MNQKQTLFHRVYFKMSHHFWVSPTANIKFHFMLDCKALTIRRLHSIEICRRQHDKISYATF